MFSRFFIGLVTVCIMCGTAASAELKLFLMPKIYLGDKELVLQDIALVEGRRDTEEVKNLVIDRGFLSDGYIDKREIFGIIKDYNGENAVIYGNAVRVMSNAKNESAAESNDFFMKKGGRVEIVVNNKGVSLILKGIAVDDARINEEVNVKIEGSRALTKVLKGKVTGRDLVEVNI